MKKIFLLGSLALIGYYWILFFRFCHPYPKIEFFTVIWVQFGISFISYLFNSKFGRIITIISGLTLVRLGPVLGMQSPMITLMGVFLGGVVGNLAREVIHFYKNKSFNFQEEDKDRFSLLRNSNSLLILFLLLLSLDRFLAYFNAPYLNGFGILETMYVPGVSSKEAFALSMEIICNLLFPLLYFYSEEIHSKNKEEILRDWKLGILFGLCIQFSIMLLQILWNRNFLAENTNLSLEANRVMGFFRDSGSSSWIIPILCFFFYEDLLARKRFFYLPLISLILIQFFIGPYQGRGFWLIFLFGLIALAIMVLKQNTDKFSKRSLIWMAVIFFALVIILYQFPRNPNSSLDRLLSIPIKLISILRRGESSILEIDPARYYLNLAAWKLFLQEPFFGNGIGSFIVNLKDPNLYFFLHENQVDNPSFFLGVLNEIGICGVVIIILTSLSRFRIGKNFFILFLLLPALSIGYHVVHPDGGFVILLVFMLAFGLKHKQDKFSNQIVFLRILILFVIFLHSIVQIFKQATVPEFRNEKLGFYQLLAYEPNRYKNEKKYHIFKGKTIWVLARVNTIKIDAFLDNSTSKKALNQRWTLLDKNRIPVSSLEITIGKEISELKLLEIPDNAYYLQIEELNEKGKTQIYGDVPYSVWATHFTGKNEFY